MRYKARISAYAARYIRERAGDLLSDRCRITRGVEHVLDPDTNEYTQPEGELIYEGLCRLWETNAGMSVQLGGEEVHVANTYLSLPWDIDPIPEMEDLVEMIESKDPDVIGRTYTLGAPARGGNLRATRKFVVKGESSSKETW